MGDDPARNVPCPARIDSVLWLSFIDFPLELKMGLMAANL
jgi:hypothetical protein